MLAPEEWSIIGLSIKVGGVAVMGMLPIAFGIAWVLARLRFPGKLLVDALVHLPLVIPPVITGWLLLILFGTQGVIGRWLADWFGISLLFRWTGAALAAAIMAMPLMVRAMRMSIEAVDPRLEAAAQTLGASPVRTFLTITLPLSMPGIVAAAILGFARSIGEFGATITFVSSIPGETTTLSLAIYSAIQTANGDMLVWRLTFLSVGLSFIALLAAEWLSRWSRRAAAA
ncbi:molybdate ABC transporter permease subunit [Sphingobium sp. HWE2-09]|uniref:molybdate ABC transporter permease subunit n=1 Tax=Sphingobium sp. HWE2-09 TaxID=3108390 RepID=UPI002DCABE39|nr:molybdate ABC transporter permease subunit [Sphingobium sp. HWE2-09]